MSSSFALSQTLIISLQFWPGGKLFMPSYHYILVSLSLVYPVFNLPKCSSKSSDKIKKRSTTLLPFLPPYTGCLLGTELIWRYWWLFTRRENWNHLTRDFCLSTDPGLSVMGTRSSLLLPKTVEFLSPLQELQGNFTGPWPLACVSIAGTSPKGQSPGTFTGAERFPSLRYVLCLAPEKLLDGS